MPERDRELGPLRVFQGVVGGGEALQLEGVCGER